MNSESRLAEVITALETAGIRCLVMGGHAVTKLSIPQAFLLPSAPTVTDFPPVPAAIEPVVVQRLRVVPAGSPLHLTLVEAVRRQYKQVAQLTDKADKEAIRAAQVKAPPSQQQG